MIEVKNLSIKYKNTDRLVIDSVSFNVKRGETVAILGPSGCGKTTLLNYIQGLLPLNEIQALGSIRMGSVKTTRTVFQEPRLLPWFTARRNVAFGLLATGAKDPIIKKKVDAVLNLVGLRDFEDYYPNQLSLGMQQRINFARALACQPNLLLLDEPFSALDRKTKKVIQTEFKKIIKDKSIATIFVTHDLPEAKFLADRIILLGSKSTIHIKEYIKKDFGKIRLGK